MRLRGWWAALQRHNAMNAAREHGNVIDGSGNVFADIGLNQPEEVEVKARIVDAIADLLESRGITQQKAGKLVKLIQLLCLHDATSLSFDA
jgi:Helix-turn-helix domain